MATINAQLAPGINAAIAPGINAVLIDEISTAVSMSREIGVERTLSAIFRSDKYTKTENNIYAISPAGVETNLGDGVGVAIADGEYRLEVRSSADLWVDSRNNSSFSLIISGGEITLASSLPTITSLTAGRTSSTTINIVISGYATDSNIGLWFSPITPVVVTGTPDIEIEVLENITTYSYNYAQTAAEYVAVACLTDTETGISDELYLPLIPSTVTSPEDQFAQP